MKKKEVPQDESILKKVNLKDMVYAVDENGEYGTALSSGWEPKTIALDNAIREIEERTKAAKRRYDNGESSPIEYYMELHKMDIPILSSYVGLWQWQVKRHLKPAVFGKLSKKTLQKYADVFEISIDELKTLK